MSSILSRITALWQKRTTRDVLLDLGTSNTGSLLVSSFNVHNDRRSKVADSREMTRDDPRAKQIVQTLARDVIKGGFSVSLTGNRSEAAGEVLEELWKRSGFLQQLPTYLETVLRDGDIFLEISVSSDGRVMGLTRKPTLQMYRNSDAYDQFSDPERAFYWTSQPYFSELPPNDVVWFPAWVMIHARWDSDDTTRYGSPLLTAARKSYKRMEQGELDLAIRRKTRSGIKYLHKLEGASPAEIEAYKTNNEEALSDPFAAVADFFTNQSGGIEVLQGDAHLGSIEDILHHVDSFGVASPIPLELIGYGRNLNRDVLREKREQYNEAIAAIRTWVERELILPLIERQLLLLNFWPENYTIDLQWKQKREVTPVELKDLGVFVGAMQATGLLSSEVLLRLLSTYLPDFDVEAEIERLSSLDGDEVLAAQLARDAVDEPL